MKWDLPANVNARESYADATVEDIMADWCVLSGVLNRVNNNKPMSPMVNAGAMTATSLVSAADADDRLHQVLEIQSNFAGPADRGQRTDRRLGTRHQIFKTARSHGCCTVADTCTATRWKPLMSIPCNARRWSRSSI